MNGFPFPDLISPDEVIRLQDLGERVRVVLASAGLPVLIHRDPQAPPEEAPGAHISIDPTTSGQVSVHWDCHYELRSRASAEYQAGDFTGAAMRLRAAAGYALAEAMIKLLQEAGFEVGMGVDMAPDYIWVRQVQSAGL